ncbi:MAG: phosphatidate cytidylyltransferase [Lachnospiraceae bacterium]|nr:phosphatidate cytidylyltransferase [Lachnospiraceae bacterium]
MFGTRLRSSVVLVILALILLLSGDKILAAGLMLLSLIAFRELTRACGVNPEVLEKAAKEGEKTGEKAGAAHGRGEKERGTLSVGGHSWNALEMVGFIGILLYYGVVYFTERPVYWMGILAAVFLGQMAVYVFLFPVFRAEQVMTAFFSFFYSTVLFSFIYLTRSLPGGIYLVWLIFISSWICDTCAYLTGMALGKHKLAPVLSPKKSVEGAVGGVAGSALVGALFGRLLLVSVYGDPNMVWICALIGAMGAVISQVGDLAASGIKRNHGIKDYGKLIPGHGGILDRFDSVIFTAPVIYYLAKLVLGI